MPNLPHRLMNRILLFGSLLALGFTACQKKQPAEYAGLDGDYVTGTPLPQRQEGVSFLSPNVQKGQFEPIYFGFDSSDVSGSESRKVEQIASFLRGNQSTIILAGFTDERGTEEYNRGLGERRAQAVRNSLISMGVSPARIQTVSFGEEMPADPGSNESAWTRNRRVETGVVR
jgi:peptidoglycan-associated lipoprotein